jgi:hypothetical protein
MRTRFLALTLLVAGLGPATAASPPVYHAPSWELAVRHVTCKAFRHNDDGSWSQVATIVTPNGAFEGNTLKGTMESRILDLRCGAPAEPETRKD